MFANNSYHSTSPNMFAMCSSRAHLNLENIFRRCQISHWTKLEAPYKGCTVICTSFIKWSSLKIMKFLIEIFFIWTSCRTFRDRHHLISNLNPLIDFFRSHDQSCHEILRKIKLIDGGHFSRENFRSEEKSENSRELEWYYLDYVSRFLLGDVGNETMFIYCCLLFIVYLWTVMINALSKYSLFLELFHQF